MLSISVAGAVVSVIAPWTLSGLWLGERVWRMQGGKLTRRSDRYGLVDSAELIARDEGRMS